ncbi:inositol polyphosphate 5-phosphatase K isoform X2 [Rhinatrema bivittatum]|uniref:inositol polyphosphate 5-phosphatase K isoform X2 n=1 Tax=Rhinatrema bivittatum TaxID=194408 RepID=UPI001129236C|nr:inositol polyphosphate 5-phosphatase K isoform X2 [Rhinatrema bivittatum]
MDRNTGHARVPSLEVQRGKMDTEDLSQILSASSLGPSLKKFRLHLVTWNVGTASPPRDIRSLLQLDTHLDMYVIGLQEVNCKITTLLSGLVFEDPWSLFFMDILAPLGYVKISSIRMQGLILLVFVKHRHIPFVQDIHTNYTRTGLYGYWGNKGGVTIRMSVYGHMVCFMNCHLPAHMENVNQRMNDFERILEEQQFEGKTIPDLLDHDVLFWFGDLNFRIADYGIHFVREAINKSQFNLLWEKDQLNLAKKKKVLLQGFLEGPLQFKPTYKFDLQSNTYDTRGKKTLFWFNEKKRKPAWTDRILWKLKNVSQVSPEADKKSEGDSVFTVALDNYVSHMCYGISDHKPVTGTFTLQLKPLMSTPLVTLGPEGEWKANQDSLISYSAVPEFPSSTWDWIGLYKVAFRHINDYMTYAWVKDNEISCSESVNLVYINVDDIPQDGGEFVLCYYCHNKQTLTGISQPFQLKPGQPLEKKEVLLKNLNVTGGLDSLVGS